jgi:pyruvate ferredoxin oxidoreductase alpha subunit
VLSFIGGLGGKDVSSEEFDFMLEQLTAASMTGVTPPPSLLYTAAEHAQAIAALWQAGKGEAA